MLLMVYTPHSDLPLTIFYREIGEIELMLSTIAYREGRYREALISQMEAHKTIRSLKLWSKSAELTYKILFKLEKKEDIDNFLQKMHSTLSDCKKNTKQYEGLSLLIGWTWSTVQLLRALNFFNKTNTVSEDIFEYAKQMNDALTAFSKNASKFGCLRDHILLINKLTSIVENELSNRLNLDKRTFRRNYRIARIVLGFAEKTQIYVKHNLKYLLSSGLNVKIIQSPLYGDLASLKLTMAKLETLIGNLRLKSKRLNVSIKQLESSELADGVTTTGFNSEALANLEFEKALKELPERHVKYLMRLTREVEKLSSPVKKRLDSYERAIALAKEAKNFHHNLGVVCLAADLEILRGIRAKRAKNGKYRNIWGQGGSSDESDSEVSENLSQEREDDEEESEIAEILEKLSSENRTRKDKFFDFTRADSAFVSLQRYALQVINIFGDVPESLEISLAALANFQSNCVNVFFWQEIVRSARSEYRPALLKSLIKTQMSHLRYTEQKLIDELNSKYQVISYLKNHKPFDECLNKLPDYSAVAIFQFNNEMDELYLGYVLKRPAREIDPKKVITVTSGVGEDEEDEDPDNNLYWVKKFRIKPILVQELLGFLEEQKEINSLMYKTPVLTQEDLDLLEDTCDEKFGQMFKRFAEIVQPYISHFDELINHPPKKDASEDENQGDEEAEKQAAQAQPQKPAGRAGRGAKRGRNANHSSTGMRDNTGSNRDKKGDSDLNLTPGGVHNLTLLVDHRLLTLPFEMLPAFEKVGLLSKDFSLQVMYNRLKIDPESGDLKTDCSLSGMKYIAYDFKERDLEAEKQEAEKRRARMTMEENSEKSGQVDEPSSAEPKEGNEEASASLNGQQSSAAARYTSRTGGEGDLEQISEEQKIDEAKYLQLSYLFKRLQAQGLPALNGCNSSERMPSMGDWIQALENSSIFMYYGNSTMMNIISPSSLIDTVDKATPRAVVILDRINPLKKIIKKFNPIEKDLDVLPLAEFPKKNLVVSTILGASYSICNKVSVNPEVNLEFLDVLFRDVVNAGKELGTLHHQFKVSLIHFLNFFSNFSVFCLLIFWGKSEEVWLLAFPVPLFWTFGLIFQKDYILDFGGFLVPLFIGLFLSFLEKIVIEVIFLEPLFFQYLV